MKITDLTEKQLEIIADNCPEWLVKYNPEWMAYNRPDLMAKYRPEWMISKCPDWVADNRPDWNDIPAYIVNLCKEESNEKI